MKVYYRNKPIGVLKDLTITNEFIGADYPESESFINSVQIIELRLTLVNVNFMKKLLDGKIDYKFKIKDKCISGVFAETYGNKHNFIIRMEKEIKFGEN